MPIVSKKYAKEYWTGDSRDGRLVNGDGYHYFELTQDGLILEAFEVYELDDGEPVVTPVPEMKNQHWFKDLGFDSFESLDFISEDEYLDVKSFYEENSKP